MNPIRRLRCEQALTQKQLAEKAGVSLATVNRVEAGAWLPRTLTVYKLAGALGVDGEWLLDLLAHTAGLDHIEEGVTA